jgi:hypothetical protein
MRGAAGHAGGKSTAVPHPGSGLGGEGRRVAMRDSCKRQPEPIRKASPELAQGP